jgi:1-deoxy-D-xylulose-5-phosphate reductoisomerase
MQHVAVLGSTGSIGTSCLDVVAAHPDRLQAVGLVAHRKWEVLAEQARRFRPRWAVVSDESLRSSIPAGAFGATELLFGEAAIDRIASDPGVEVVVAGIVGAAGLRSTWTALEAGKRVAFANKETLVVAGPLMTSLAQRTGGSLFPVDSEHSAVYQSLQAGRHAEVRRIVLTASGGPFRGYTLERMREVTPEMALAHPTWAMGPKVTVDSATMMNKALEMIEAKWLFGLDADQIAVMIHPQSIVHSCVEFVDGSVVAQLSPPDMKLPIQYALTWPERWEGISPRLDWTSPLRLDFTPPDPEAFPALKLGAEVARRGGTSGAVLNAANEVAVERFLARDLRFTEIPQLCRSLLDAHNFEPSPSLTDLLRMDRWTRDEARRWRPLERSLS